MKSISAIILLFGIMLVSCGKATKGNKSETKSNLRWVYLVAQTAMQTDTTEFFLYGQIKTAIAEDLMGNQKSSGVFHIEKLRYYNDDDLLEIYEDEKDEGLFIFRIQDVRRIELLKKDPVLSMDEEELSEKSLKYKKKELKNIK
ncbi:MAG: hypothetical protein ACI9XP_001809 [Lentimonas sp.]|jgi:hypothetical protein